MAQKTHTEKDHFLQAFERECQTTLKVLKALPEDKSDFTPHPKLRSAKDLAWTFVAEQGLSDHAMAGSMNFAGSMPPPPDKLSEVIRAFEKTSRETMDKVSKAGDDTLNRTIQFPAGPGRMADVRVQDVLWFCLNDQIHHRGQLSVYVRMTGGKVPSIYGPTADEPWR
jgi:uncharacterized damage-inducible protein DinB